MKLRWTDRARRNLLAIGRYIAQDNPVAARRWGERLQTCAQQAATMPMAGRVVPELHRNDIREVFVRPYRIVYRVREDAIDVLTVFEGHRLFDTTDLPEIDK